MGGAAEPWAQRAIRAKVPELTPAGQLPLQRPPMMVPRHPDGGVTLTGYQLPSGSWKLPYEPDGGTGTCRPVTVAFCPQWGPKSTKVDPSGTSGGTGSPVGWAMVGATARVAASKALANLKKGFMGLFP